MTRSAPDTVTFVPPELEGVCARIDAIAAAGEGWVNLRPEVDPDDEPSEPGLLAGIFATIGPGVPVCTWIPGKTGRHGREPDSIGVLHPRGQQLGKRLDDLAIPLPTGWRIVQDHPRRGMVIRIPVGADLHAMVAWLVRAGEVLATVALTGTWRCEVHGQAANR